MFDEDTLTKFRSYSELKKDMKELNLEAKTDFEIITELVKEFKNILKGSKDEKRLVILLEDFEFYVHNVGVYEFLYFFNVYYCTNYFGN